MRAGAPRRVQWSQKGKDTVRIIQAAAATDPGARREHNEDAVIALADLPLLGVADGMGGPEPGSAASSLALDVARANAERLEQARDRIAGERSTANRLALTGLFDELFNAASRTIGRVKEEMGEPGMGTTLTLATLVRNFAYVAHVGDSRAYVIRDGHPIRLTEDHSLAEFKYRRGRISREEFETSDERRLLYQALGAGVEVEVDVAEMRLADGDVLLLCSDGLTRALDEDVAAGLVDATDLEASARALIDAAGRAGAEDNVSVVLGACEAEPDDEPLEAIAEVLADVFLFRDIAPTERMVVAPYLEEAVYEGDRIVCAEGDPADAFYVVASGGVKITRGPTHLTDVGPGGHFGELALARPTTRSATVRTRSRTRLFALSRSRFRELIRHKPELGARLSIALLDAVGDRLRDLSDRLAAVELAVRGELNR